MQACCCGLIDKQRLSGLRLLLHGAWWCCCCILFRPMHAKAQDGIIISPSASLPAAHTTAGLH